MKPASRIMVRTSGSEEVGSGHVRRCLTLAQALAHGGATVKFLLRGTPTAATSIRESGFDVATVSHDFSESIDHVIEWNSDLAVVDANEVTDVELRQLRRMVPLVVIDDICARTLDADIITNSAAYAQELPYPKRNDCLLLLGPRFALLREEFTAVPPREAERLARRALITLGGSDLHNVTPRLVEWTKSVCSDLEVVVVAGPYFSNVAQIEASGPNEILINPVDMASVIRSADIAVSGGGQTTYELAATGVPTVAVQVGYDQKRNLEALHAAGVLIHLGHATDPALEHTFRQNFSRVARAAEVRAQMSQRGRTLVDGRGAARVAEAVLNFGNPARDVKALKVFHGRGLR